MYSALVIASQFVNRAIENGKPVTQMKLQKMLYIAQGLHLAYTGKPIINETIQAWKYGPVIPNIYDYYKNWGNFPIIKPTIIGAFSESAISTGLDVLCDSAENIIDITWDITKDIDAVKLSNWTHEINSPWHKSFYGAGCVDTCTVPISHTLISDYFKTTFGIELTTNNFATA
jgi:uncharacterized phage-associated protein